MLSRGDVTCLPSILTVLVSLSPAQQQQGSKILSEELRVSSACKVYARKQRWRRGYLGSRSVKTGGSGWWIVGSIVGVLGRYEI